VYSIENIFLNVEPARIHFYKHSSLLLIKNHFIKPKTKTLSKYTNITNFFILFYYYFFKFLNFLGFVKGIAMPITIRLQMLFHGKELSNVGENFLQSSPLKRLSFGRNPTILIFISLTLTKYLALRKECTISTTQSCTSMIKLMSQGTSSL